MVAAQRVTGPGVQGGYVNGTYAPSPLLASAFAAVDAAVGSIVDALQAHIILIYIYYIILLYTYIYYVKYIKRGGGGRGVVVALQVSVDICVYKVYYILTYFYRYCHMHFCR